MSRLVAWKTTLAGSFPLDNDLYFKMSCLVRLMMSVNLEQTVMAVAIITFSLKMTPE